MEVVQDKMFNNAFSVVILALFPFLNIILTLCLVTICGHSLKRNKYMEVQTERLDDGGMMEKRINVTSSDARTHLKCMFVNGLLSSTFVAC